MEYEQAKKNLKREIIEFIQRYRLDDVKNEVLKLVEILENAKRKYERMEIAERIWSLLRGSLSRKGYVVVEEEGENGRYIPVAILKIKVKELSKKFVQRNGNYH